MLNLAAKIRPKKLGPHHTCRKITKTLSSSQSKESKVTELK